MISPTTAMSVARKYLNWAEAACYCGLSEETLRRLERRGRLKVFRPTARRVLLDVAELDRLVASTAVAV